MTTSQKPITKHQMFDSVEIPDGLVQKVDWAPITPKAPKFSAPKLDADGQPVGWIKGSGWFPDQNGQLVHWSYKRPASVDET